MIFIEVLIINFYFGDQSSRYIYSSPKGPAGNKIDKHKTTKDPRNTGRKDGHIILSLRGFEPMACGRMRCAQLRAA